MDIRTKIFLLATMAVGAGMFVLLAAGAVVVSKSGVASREATGQEKRLLVTVDRIAQFVDIPGKRSLCETCVTRKNFTGSTELEYLYDTDKDPDARKFLYLVSEAETLNSETRAKETFSDQVQAYQLGTSLVAGRKMEPKPYLSTLGDDRYSSTVTQDGKPIGNIVVARKGSVVYSLVIFGVYFEDQQSLESLFDSAME